MSNPMLKTLTREYAQDGEQMSIKGTVAKTFGLFAIALISALYTWQLVATGMMDKANIFALSGAGVALVCVIVSAFNPQHSKILSIVYAFCEGLVLGAISAAFESFYQGIVPQAFFATFVTLFVMLTLYKAGVIRATQTFQRIMFIAIVSILVFYLAVFVTTFFNISFLAPLVAAYNNPLVIGIIIVVAAASLIIDFNAIESYANSYMPKYFEWYCAMSLMVTLVWLYFEFLRFFARLRSR